MAPLDTASVTHSLRLADPFGGRLGGEPAADQYQTLGQFLRAVRESKNYSLLDMEVETRVHRNHLAALEANDLSRLPSRPFTIGYVRSYAKALGLDPDAEVGRFRQENPENAEPLRAPIGVAHQEPERRPVIFVGIGVLVAAVVLWNIAQRTLISNAPPASSILAVQDGSPPEPVVKKGQPFGIAAPTPASVEQNTPALYQTPGMSADVAAQAAAKTAAPALGAPTLGTPFEARGTVYGAAGSNAVILKADKRASLVVRGAGGQILFARQLAPGEAYRAPAGHGLTADVSDPGAFEVYSGGQYKASLSDMQTPLDRYAPVAAPVQVAAAPAAVQAPAAPAQSAPAAPGTH